MADGRGGSRIGGFFRGVLMGLLVCAIAAVALSLSAPVPEREAIIVEPEALGGGAVEPGSEDGPDAATAPEPGTAPGADAAAAPAAESADVSVVPAGEPAGTAEPPAAADQETAAPQATWQAEPATGAGSEPEGASDFSTPQPPSQ